MTKSFDDWYNTYDNLQCDKDACEDAYEAGQQSKQAEIDELLKRIDDAIVDIEHSGVMYGFNEELYSVLKILKGNTNDH